VGGGEVSPHAPAWRGEVQCRLQGGPTVKNAGFGESVSTS
jgi:hypothetical protein